MPRRFVALNWVRLLPLDASLALAVIAVCLALCLSQVGAALDKVGLVSVWASLASSRVATVERFAVRGQLLAVAEAGTSPSTKRSAGEIAYVDDGMSVLASGVLRYSGTEFKLAINPAVNETALGWSVIWLCGRRQAPAGWQGPAGMRSEGLSAEQLPVVCRERAGP